MSESQPIYVSSCSSSPEPRAPFLTRSASTSSDWDRAINPQVEMEFPENLKAFVDFMLGGENPRPTSTEVRDCMRHVGMLGAHVEEFEDGTVHVLNQVSDVRLKGSLNANGLIAHWSIQGPTENPRLPVRGESPTVE